MVADATQARRSAMLVTASRGRRGDIDLIAGARYRSHYDFKRISSDRPRAAGSISAFEHPSGTTVKNLTQSRMFLKTARNLSARPV